MTLEGTPAETGVRVAQTQRMRERLGSPTPAELAAIAPPDRSVHPRLAVPEGWSEVNVQGAHQTLMLDASAGYRGILTQVRVAVAGPEQTTTALAEAVPSSALPLAVEQWTGGGWQGVHRAWIGMSRGLAVLHRLWELPLVGGGWVEVAAQYTAAFAAHLDGLVDSLVAGLELSDPEHQPAPAERAAEQFRQRQAERSLPESMHHPLLLGQATLDWLRDQRGLSPAARLPLEPPSPPSEAVAAGVAAADSTPAEAGQMILDHWRQADSVVAVYRSDRSGGSGDTGPSGSRLAGRLWRDGPRVLVLDEGDGSGERRLGVYRSAEAATLVLRLAGMVPEGPSAPPADILTWEDLAEGGSAGRAHSSSWHLVPLAVGANEDPVARPRPDTTRGGLPVLTVHGAGHYRLGADPDAGPAGTVRLEPVSGMGLYRLVAEWLDAREPSAG